MNAPIQIGWPQLILFLIAVAGIGLLISTLTGMFRLTKELEEFEDETGRTFRRWRHRRHFRPGRGMSGILMLVLAISLLWFTFTIQTYLGLTGDIKAATVHAVPSANHVMTIDLTLYDSNGNQTSQNRYSVPGDLWFLKANVIEYKQWVNILGVHSQYKITQLFGMYNDPNGHYIKPIPIAGGDGDFYTAAHNNDWWTSPFVQQTYGNAVTKEADGQTYDVFVDQKGLHL